MFWRHSATLVPLLLGRLARQQHAPVLPAAIAATAPHFQNVFSSQASSMRSFASEGGERDRRAVINKLLYRSQQRGFLELDLLVGLWAQKEVPAFSDEALAQFEHVLNLENPDLFKWLTGQEAPPPEVAANGAFASLKSHVDKHLADYRNARTTAKQGAAWVRGWEDNAKAQAKQAPPGTSH